PNNIAGWARTRDRRCVPTAFARRCATTDVGGNGGHRQNPPEYRSRRDAVGRLSRWRLFRLTRAPERPVIGRQRDCPNPRRSRNGRAKHRGNVETLSARKTPAVDTGQFRAFTPRRAPRFRTLEGNAKFEGAGNQP